MNTFTLLGKLVDLDIVYPSSMEGSMVARITLDTYHQGIMQSSYQIALFRGNAEVAVQGYKQGAWH